MSYVQGPATVVAGLAATLLLAGSIVTDAQAAGAGHKARAQAAQGNASRSTQVQRSARDQTRQRNTTWSNASGRQVQVESVTQRTDNGRTTSTTATREDGRTATRQTTVARDPQAGTRSVQSTATGFNGATTSYSSQAQRTDDGYTRDVSRTLPNGQVNERDIDVSCDAAVQTCTKTVVGSRGE
jgi:hypothetical protein